MESARYLFLSSVNLVTASVCKKKTRHQDLSLRLFLDKHLRDQMAVCFVHVTLRAAYKSTFILRFPCNMAPVVKIFKLLVKAAMLQQDYWM